MEQLARYYTSDLFSNLLIEQFSTSDPQNIVELGVGGGSLVKAAINRWINASYYVADVDPNSLSKLKSELPFVKSFHFDTVKENVAEKLNLKQGTVDLAVCNPPYLKLKNDLVYNDIFEGSKLKDCIFLKQLTTDIIFLAKNLQLLKDKGELGIILPDSLITGKEFEHLRAAIIKEHNLKGIIQLPEKVFPKTEALTHILFIEKGIKNQKPAPLFLANKQGQIIDSIEVNKDALVNRMDFQFHSWKAKQNIKYKKKTVTLKSLDVEIKRGTYTHQELKQLNDNFIHTTDLINKKSNQSYRSAKRFDPKYLLTKKGDILLTRVGAIGKVTMVLRGQAPVTDCIYRIRVKEPYRLKVWESLISQRGQEWLKANSHGVCAKVISKLDLLEFPINI